MSENHLAENSIGRKSFDRKSFGRKPKILYINQQRIRLFISRWHLFSGGIYFHANIYFRGEFTFTLMFFCFGRFLREFLIFSFGFCFYWILLIPGFLLTPKPPKAYIKTTKQCWSEYNLLQKYSRINFLMSIAPLVMCALGGFGVKRKPEMSRINKNKSQQKKSRIHEEIGQSKKTLAWK